MYFIKLFFKYINRTERLGFLVATLIFVLATTTRGVIAFDERSVWAPISGGSYREGVVGQPIALNPVISGNPVDLDISALLYSTLYDVLETYTSEQNGRVYVIKLKEDLLWD